jgi:RHS repeat-associated protein
MLPTTKNQLQDTNNDYVYDSAGNLTQPGPIGGPYVYDAENHLTSAGGVTYTYDGDGNRVMKSNGTIYWYGSNSASLMETDLSGNVQHWYYFFDGQLLARQLTTNEVGFYMTDHLGSVRYLGGSSTGYSMDYYPFGGIILNSDTGDDRYQFTGKERDAESGLDNFGARFDSSSMGRFMSPDSGTDQHPEAPQSWNLYAYALNNPLNLVDPTGEYVCGGGITQTMCDNFQTGLNAAQQDADKLKGLYGADSTEYQDAQRAIDVYGKENIDNGVTLVLGGISPGADGQVDPNVGSVAPTKNNPLGQQITVHFNEDTFTGSGDSAINITHEGSHAADASDWVKSGFSRAMNPNNFNSEWRAFHVSQSIAEAAGYGSLGFYNGNSRDYVWKSAWAKQPGWRRTVDGAIDSMLRNKSGLYHLDPNSKIGAFKRNTKGNN